MRKLIVILALFFTMSLFATDGKSLANKLGLSASSKASKQWTRVFDKENKMEKLGINTLSDADKKALLEYLTSHAADSDRPEAAGM